MIAGAIAFNAGKEALFMIRMSDSKIDLITRDANLKIDLVPFGTQPLADLDFEVAVRLVLDAFHGGAASVLGVFQVALQDVWPFCARLAGLYVGRS
jgi:hypothetical protein